MNRMFGAVALVLGLSLVGAPAHAETDRASVTWDKVDRCGVKNDDVFFTSTKSVSQISVSHPTKTKWVLRAVAGEGAKFKNGTSHWKRVVYTTRKPCN